MRMRQFLTLGALVGLGVGLGWWIHPGVGLAAVGLVVWIDFTIEGFQT